MIYVYSKKSSKGEKKTYSREKASKFETFKMSEKTAMKWYCQICRQSGSSTLIALPNKQAFSDHVKSFHPEIIKITEKMASFKCIECKFQDDQKGNFLNHFKAIKKLQNVKCCPNFIITSKCAWRIHIDSDHDGQWNCSSCKSEDS